MNSVQGGRHVERVVGVGTDDFDRVRLRVESLVRLGAASFIVPSRVTMARGDQVAVTEPPRDHDTLRAVLDARGALRAGECVWLGVAIAEALTVLHKAGLVHGAIDSEAVVIDGGRVRLARLIDGAEDARAADDIAALGRLLAAAVRESDSDRIHAWTEPMTHPDPQGRPTAAMVVHALASCAPPEEVLLPPVDVAGALRRAATSNRGGAGSQDVGHGAAPQGTVFQRTAVQGAASQATASQGAASQVTASPRPLPNGASEDGGRHHGAAVPLRESRGWRIRLKTIRSLKWLGVAIAAVAVVGVAGLGLTWATHSGPWAGTRDVATEAALGVPGGRGSAIVTPEKVVTSEQESLQSPDAAAERLTVARFEALARGDGDALIALTVAGSPARAEAEDAAVALRSGLLRVDGLEGTVEDSVRLGADAVDASLGDGGGAVVRVHYRLGPHAVVANGETTDYDGYEQTVDLTLQWVEGTGWLVSDVVNAKELGS